MKKVLLIIFLSVAVFGNTFAQKRVAFTNIELIMSLMPAMQEIQKAAEEYEKQLNASLKVTQNYYEQKVTDYYTKKDAGTMTLDEEKKLVNDIASLEEELVEKQKINEQKLMNKRLSMLQPIQNQLQKAINDVAKEKGYTFVINQVMGEGIPTILYGKPEHDITKDVLKKLGVEVPEGDGTEAPKSGQ